MSSLQTKPQPRSNGTAIFRRGGVHGLLRRVIRIIIKSIRITRRRLSNREGSLSAWKLLFLIGIITFTLVTLKQINDAKLLKRLVGCQTAEAAASTIYVTRKKSSILDRKHVLQVIVLTQGRVESLDRLIASLRAANYGNQEADLRIWVDRVLGWDGGLISLMKGIVRVFCGGFWDLVNTQTIEYGNVVNWPHGDYSLHVWNRHVGIWGQWLDSWRPGQDEEWAIILEDDLEVSPQYYAFLSKAREKYGKRDDIFGYTLQRGTLRANQTGFGRRELRVDEKEEIFLYPLLGSWGYAPEARVWKRLRKWYHEKSCERGFHPYVEGLIPTKWYKKQEAKRSMWTMWHIKYAYEFGLFTVYANLPGRKTLASNWREPGLHFKSGNSKRASAVTKQQDFELLREHRLGGEWMYEMPNEPIKLAWNGTYMDHNGIRTRF